MLNVGRTRTVHVIVSTVVLVALFALPAEATGGEAKVKAYGCDKCHGEDGVSEFQTTPNLAGQNELYLVNQLKKFHGTLPMQGVPSSSPTLLGGDVKIERHDQIMDVRAGVLTDADIGDIATYYSGLPCGAGGEQAPSAPPPPLVENCQECHGSNSRTSFPGTPNLSGQKKLYLIKQLGAFRLSGEGVDIAQDGRHHHIMSSKDKPLSGTDIESLATYFSGLSCR